MCGSPVPWQVGVLAVLGVLYSCCSEKRQLSRDCCSVRQLYKTPKTAKTPTDRQTHPGGRVEKQTLDGQGVH